MGLSQGVRLGPYQIVSPLGAGGMGTVYKATDTRLGRTVAIKVLADRASSDPQQRLRFEQEARAVSTLNHPNICVLYDVGCETPSGGHPSDQAYLAPSGPVQFLVMEHLDGETLSKRLREGGVSFDQALDIGAQVADALAKAHRHGVIHRDLKPGNIMLTRSGAGVHAKLLDFGLAKLRQAPDPDLVSTHPKHEPETRPGAVLGTLPYMPPEQLEGRPTDARADVFALGCVLYEMLTGRRAFKGSSEASVISAIMAHEPEALATLQPATPAALDHLIRRCLQKDPDQRAESAHDLAEELRWLREAHRSSSNSDGHPRRRATDPASDSGQTIRSSAPAALGKRRRLVPLALGLIAVAVASYAVPAYLRGRWPWQRDPWSNATAQQITTQPGLQIEPAVSPDGHLIAYVQIPDGGGMAHIWLTDASGKSTRQLTLGAAPDSDPEWDPTTNEVLFTRSWAIKPEIWSVPSLNGPERRELEDAGQPAVSPDGGQLAFVREEALSGETRVLVAPRRNLSQATQLTHSDDGLWDHSHPRWSADGRWICYQAQYALWIVPAKGGAARRLTTDNESATHPVWSPDRRWIYYTSSAGGPPALWRVSWLGGTPKRSRSSSGAEREPSFSRDGSLLAFSTGEPNRDIVLQTIPGREPGIAFGTVRYESMPRFTPDGQAVVYVSGPNWTRNELYVQRLSEGLPAGEPRQLTDHGEGEVDHPAVSKDGRWVAYYRVVKGQRDIWTVPLDNGPPRQVTTHQDNDIQPAWSPDGSRLAFVSERGGHRNIWTVPVSNGAAKGIEVQVTRANGQAQAPEWSPGDGKWIAYVAGPKSTEMDVWMSRADGSDTHPVTSGAGAYRIRWVREDVMVVSGTWGGPTLSLRLVDPATGASTAFDPRVIIGDDPAMCDFDIDLERKLVLFSRKVGQGHVWTLTKR